MVFAALLLLAGAAPPAQSRFDLVCRGTVDVYNVAANFKSHDDFQWEASVDLDKRLVYTVGMDGKGYGPESLLVLPGELIWNEQHVSRSTGELTKHTSVSGFETFAKGQCERAPFKAMPERKF